FKSQVNQDVVLQILILQRQSKLDEVAGPATQPPLTTPLERRDISPQLSITLEHIVGQLDVLTQVLDNTINKVAEEVLSPEELEERQLKIQDTFHYAHELSTALL
ncbi:hypothetical protein pdam_00025075, partial [Pocillopora damicornis]